jgi:chromosomal replication initiator protein
LEDGRGGDDMTDISIRPIEPDELGIVTELQERRVKYARFIDKRANYIVNSPRTQEQITKLVNERVKAEVDAIMASQVTKEMAEMAALKAREPKIETILMAVWEATGWSIQDLLGPRRSRPLSRARHIAFYLCKTLRKDLTLMQIGKALGKDHTSVIDAMYKFPGRRDAEPIKSWMEHPAIKALLP